MNDIIYGYFSAHSLDKQMNRLDFARIEHKGYICVAIKRPPKGCNQTEYTAAFSFCSPVDQLNKKKATQISSGRLLSGRPGRTVQFTFDKGEKLLFKDLFRAALEAGKDKLIPHHDGYNRTMFPRWLTDSGDPQYCDTITYGR